MQADVNISVHNHLPDSLEQKITGLSKNSPNFNFFQSPAFFRLAGKTRNFTPLLLAAHNAQGKLISSLLVVMIRESSGIRGRLSMRAVVYGGPVLYAEAELKDVLPGLLKKLSQTTGKKAIFTQFRNFMDLHALKPVFRENGFLYRPRLNLLINTHSREDVWKGMSPSRRRQIKKGLSFKQGGLPHADKPWNISMVRHPSGGNALKGLEIIVPGHVGQVRTFYGILEKLYRYRVRKPLPDWSFFENFYYLTQESPEWGVILLVIYNEKVIGGILSPITPGRTVYELYVCGLDREYKDQHPSTLATWAAIDHALQKNIPQFDFMGVGIPGKPYGVREFKKRFGGRMVNYGRYVRINNKIIYNIAELGYNILSVFRKV
ncbi:MAG: peptidoglycan bridge formation glycyltransferase FemA/FemB family protein [Bacteroidales bacterium]